jgi:ribosomal protein S18 acetylase RimI-like enzyme
VTNARVDIRVLEPGDEPKVEALLEAHADSSLFLRCNLLAGLVNHGDRYQGTWAGAFDATPGDGRLVAVAMHSWFGSILIQAPVHVAAVVAAAACASARPVAGFIGPWIQALAARDALGLTEAPMRLESHEGLYALPLDGLVVPALLASGRAQARRSRPADLDLLTEWRVGYRVDTNAEHDGPELRTASRADVEIGLAEGSGWVLELDGAPVAYQQFNAMMPDVVQVGGVWTPPSLRGRGYGRSVVAGALLGARAEGVRRGVLFTGETNLAARRAYVALGFTRVGDWALIFLQKPARPAL